MPGATAKPPAGRAERVGLDRLAEFDEVIDARSPSEYAEDHLPGSINLPVLDDEERARVGTIYVQESPFTAKKIGAAAVSRNIARHLDDHFFDKPKAYRPLVYCWRGGSRSGSLTHVLRSVGWQAAQLEGGYKAYRRQVVADLAAWPERFRLVVVCGPTGVGKSRFLRALAEAGCQVLDLEELAAHMGSVLGAYPTRPQPSQKQFESDVWHALHGFAADQPVFVESESKKIGNLHTPDALLARMRNSECLTLTASTALRVSLLKEEYAHFLAEPERLGLQLDCLIGLKGRDTVERWKRLGQEGAWDELVAELLETHYDPAYSRSLGKNYVNAAKGPRLTLASGDAAGFQELAREVLDSIPPLATLKM